MTGGDANKAEVEIELKGDAVEQVKKLADEMERAADKTDEAKKKVEQFHRVTSNLGRLRAQAAVKSARDEEQAEQRKNRTISSLARQRAREDEQNERRKTRVLSGLAKQRAQEEAREQKETESRRNRVLSGLASQRANEERRRGNRPLTETQEAGRRILAGEREERIQKLMGQMSPKKGLTGLAGWAAKAEGKFGLPSGSLSGLAGKAGKLAGPAATAAAFASAGKFALDTGMTISHQMQYGNPYADDFVRGREQVQNAPFAKEYFAVTDLLSGRAKAMKAENRRRMETDLEGRFESQRFEATSEQWRKERVAALNAQTVRDIPLPGMASTARSTQEEKRQYDLAQRLLPLQERRAEAERAAAEATNEQTTNLERLRKQEEYLAGLRKKKADIEGRFTGGVEGTVGYIGALGDLTRVGRQIEEAEKSHAGLRERVQQGAANAASARYQANQAGVAVSAGQLEDLRRRESVASSQNQRLAFAGREGRAMAIHWKRQADQFGISNLPPEAISTVVSFFPEYARQQGEQEGERFRKEFASLSSEYRDSLPAARQRVDTAESQVRGQKEASARDYKDAVFEGMRQGGLPAMREFGKELNEQVNRMIRDAKDQLIYEMMLKAYNLPGGGG